MKSTAKIVCFDVVLLSFTTNQHTTCYLGVIHFVVFRSLEFMRLLLPVEVIHQTRFPPRDYLLFNGESVFMFTLLRCGILNVTLDDFVPERRHKKKMRKNFSFIFLLPFFLGEFFNPEASSPSRCETRPHQVSLNPRYVTLATWLRLGYSVNVCSN